MDILFKCLHGSHLYGTQNSNSDKDFKVIFNHDLESLIINPYECNRTKNNILNEETAFFSSKKYAIMLKQQQTIALEMLFSPPSNWIEFHSDWERLKDNTEKCVSKNILPFTGYAKEQARMYSTKGYTYTAIKELYTDINEFMMQLPDTIKNSIKAAYYIESPGFKLLLDTNPTIIELGVKYLNKTSTPIHYTKIINKQFENHLPLKEWHDRLDLLVQSFGDRTRKAAVEGMDRKAMSSAVRIICEAIELLETGKLTFPRPEVDLLREIRYNESVTYEQTADIISKLHDKLILKVAPVSKLKDHPDEEYIDSWFMAAQKQAILNDYCL